MMSKANKVMANNNNIMANYYDQNKANVLRLKVNKVNLIQKLEPNDEIITKLINSKTLTYEEAASIMSGRSREDKAKNLVSTLIGKNDSSASSNNKQQQLLNSGRSNNNNNNNNKTSLKKDWYYHFRKVLIDQGYAELVTFLDNTIINKPKFVEKFSSMSVGNTRLGTGDGATFSRESIDDEMSETRSFFNKTTAATKHSAAAKSFKYKIKPSYLVDELKSSKDPNDLKQLAAEIEAFEQFKQLEKLSAEILGGGVVDSIAADSSSSLSPAEFILDTNVLKNILDLADMHLYIKYFKQFAETHKIDYLRVLCTLMVESFQKDRVIRLQFYSNLDELVHKLAWTFIRNERPKLADEMLTEYMSYIDFLETYVDRLNKENNSGMLERTSSRSRTQNDNSRFILLISKLNTLSNLIIVKNALDDFASSLALYKNAKELLSLTNKYEMEVNTTILFYGIANTYYELGNFEKASSAINKSLLTVCYENDLLIEILGTASLIYSLNWHLKEAEQFAILAVQSARAIYGVNHSQFVRALLHYCYFSNEFIQDESSINACKYTLALAKKVYGCNCLALADAYRSLSKALIVNKYFKEDIYFEYAQKSLKIANEMLNSERDGKNAVFSSNPRLIPFKLAFVSALQWKSINSDSNDTKQSNLNEAYNLAVEALKTCMNLLGQVNVYSAKIYRFIGSLLYYMERDTDSEKIHKKSVEILESLLPTNNFHCLLAKSTLGVFYKMIGSIDDAISCLLDVINYLRQEEIQGIMMYCKWIPSIYSNLSECYKIKKFDELAANYQRQADNMKSLAFARSSSSTTTNYEIDFEMYRNPPSDLNEYLKELIK